MIWIGPFFLKMAKHLFYLIKFAVESVEHCISLPDLVWATIMERADLSLFVVCDDDFWVQTLI
jgi:hypothetical protein